jgi:hypothetical protein
LGILSRLRLFYLRHFSKPSSDRLLYREVYRRQVRKIVELGVGDFGRTLRMLEIAGASVPAAELSYVGMDLFEARMDSDSPGLSLKEAHQRLRSTGARVQLVPGNPPDSLARTANALGRVDLLILPEEFDGPETARMWFFVPRMLHEASLVLVERQLPDGLRHFDAKPSLEIERLASLATARRAA